MDDADLYDSLLTAEEFNKQNSPTAVLKKFEGTTMARAISQPTQSQSISSSINSGSNGVDSNALTCLHLSQLPWWTSEDDLRASLPSAAPHILKFKFLTNALTGKSRGVLLLMMESVDAAKHMHELLSHMEVNGVKPMISFATEKAFKSGAQPATSSADRRPNSVLSMATRPPAMPMGIPFGMPPFMPHVPFGVQPISKELLEPRRERVRENRQYSGSPRRRDHSRSPERDHGDRLRSSRHRSSRRRSRSHSKDSRERRRRDYSRSPSPSRRQLSKSNQRGRSQSRSVSPSRSPHPREVQKTSKDDPPHNRSTRRLDPMVRQNESNRSRPEGMMERIGSHGQEDYTSKFVSNETIPGRVVRRQN